MEEKQIILLVLTLIDISLAGNLVLIILFSGYENFVSKIEAAHNDVDRPGLDGARSISRACKIKNWWPRSWRSRRIHLAQRSS